MSGGLMQLVAYGAQDVYLTGEPQITFWKGVYRRHTHFAVESIENTVSGSGFGANHQIVISRNADLLHGIHLQIKLPALDSTAYVDTSDANFGMGTASNAPKVCWVNSIGHRFISDTTVYIGGQPVDKHYGLWLEIWDELTQSAEKEAGYNTMVGKYSTEVGLYGNADTEKILYVPLQFWFCRHPGSAIPLVALQFHEVKLHINCSDFKNCITLRDSTGAVPVNAAWAAPTLLQTTNTGLNMRVYCDYVYLDEDERQRFSQQTQEYLIEQLQKTDQNTLTANQSNTANLVFNHPVKELVWILRRSDNANSSGNNILQNDYFNFSTGAPGAQATGGHVLRDEDTADNVIKFNNAERASARPASYYSLVQPYQHHTRIPSKNIYNYSFALRPEEHQPSGSTNFSRIDNATLTLDIGDVAAAVATAPAGVTSGYDSVSLECMIYGVNYNVLRIQSGLGGLAYSN